MEKIECIQCGKCSNCPEWIEIPKIFEMYNTYLENGDREALKAAYAALGTSNASVCVCCGFCARQCPKHIRIPDRLAEIAKVIQSL